MYVSNDSPVVLGGVVEEVGGAVERKGGDWEVGETDADEERVWLTQQLQGEEQF